MDEDLSTEQTVLERIASERAMRAPLFGRRRAEEASRQRNANEVDHGGQPRFPEPDLTVPEAPEPIAAIDDAGLDVREGGGLIDEGSPPSPLFSSPLPDHAFPTGDLDEVVPVEPAPTLEPARATRQPRAVGRIFKRLFTKH